MCLQESSLAVCLWLSKTAHQIVRLWMERAFCSANRETQPVPRIQAHEVEVPELGAMRIGMSCFVDGSLGPRSARSASWRHG